MKSLLIRLAHWLARCRVTRAVANHLLWPTIAHRLKCEVRPDEPSPSGIVEALGWKMHAYIVLSEELKPTGRDCCGASLEHSHASRQRLFETVAEAIDGVDGDILEFGVATGESLIAFARLFDNRQCYGFDSFDGIPEQWWTRPKGSFKSAPPTHDMANVALIDGAFAESIPQFLRTWDGAAALLHVDCDLYRSTLDCLIPLERYLKPGLVIVFDEYWNYPVFAEHEWLAWRQIRSKFGIEAPCLAYDGRRAAFKISSVTR